MKVAIITGGGSGIGLGAAKALSEMGMAIVGVGRDKAKLADLEAAIGDPSKVATLSVDVMEDSAPKQICDLALDRFGRIDFLVNNAGVGSPKPVHETDDDTLDYFLDLMLRSPFRMCREALLHMKAGSGIVNITSTYAVVGGLRGGAYSAAKAGLAGLTSHLAVQYGPLGIRSNNVAPGVIRTAMTEARFDDQRFVRMNVEMTPYPRLATIEDVAGAIAFLCSPQAEVLNNQTIIVDGGWSNTKYFSERGLNSVWTSPEA